MLSSETFLEVSRQVFTMCFLKVLLLLVIAGGFPSRGLCRELCRTCSPGCDPGWLQFGNNCYFFNHDKQGKANWNDAAKTCQFLGGHLVDIRSEDERQFVKDNLRKGGDEVWDQYIIGMTDAVSEGQWKYTDGSAVSFFKWKRGEPNGGRRENCGGIFSDTNIGYYNDGSCTYKYGRFICKKRASE